MVCLIIPRGSGYCSATPSSVHWCSVWSSCLSTCTKDPQRADLAQLWPTCQCMVIAGPAAVLSRGVLDNSERLGSLLRHFECSVLVIGVVELSQPKRPTTCRLGQILASMPLHGGSGTGRSLVEWFAGESRLNRGTAPPPRVQCIVDRCGRAASAETSDSWQTWQNCGQHASA